MDHNKLWKILKEMGIPDHLTCLLRNLCAGEEATFRNEPGTIVDVKSLELCTTLWDTTMDCSLLHSSVPGFSGQEYWSGLPFPSPEDLPNPGVEPMSFMSPALAGGFFNTSATWEVQTGSKL